MTTTVIYFYNYIYKKAHNSTDSISFTKLFFSYTLNSLGNNIQNTPK